MVVIPEDLAAYVKTRIERFAHERPEELSWQESYVERHRALPLLVDWTSTVGLTPDGRLVEWSTDDDSAWVQNAEDARRARLALFQGAKRYPALAALIPSRPDNAIDCPSCGRNEELAAAMDLRNLICHCGGLRWLLPDEVASSGAG
jgi:hypothetical protein